MVWLIFHFSSSDIKEPTSVCYQTKTSFSSALHNANLSCLLNCTIIFDSIIHRLLRIDDNSQLCRLSTTLSVSWTRNHGIASWHRLKAHQSDLSEISLFFNIQQLIKTHETDVKSRAWEKNNKREGRVIVLLLWVSVNVYWWNVFLSIFTRGV